MMPSERISSWSLQDIPSEIDSPTGRSPCSGGDEELLGGSGDEGLDREPLPEEPTTRPLEQPRGLPTDPILKYVFPKQSFNYFDY